jgi:hypothetical protein
MKRQKEIKRKLKSQEKMARRQGKNKPPPDADAEEASEQPENKE